jgi:hypothetical protein
METPSRENETNVEGENESSMRNESKPVVKPPLQDAPRRDTNASTVEKSPPTRIQIPTIPDKGQPVVSSTKPLRSVRKAFAKATGLHGAFTKEYKEPSTKSAATPLPKRIPARGSAPEPRRIPQELVQNPPRRPPQQGLQSLSSRPGDSATAEVRNASQSLNATRQSEPPSSLLKPGLPAFGRDEGASVPPGRRETINTSLRPPQPPPPPMPTLEGTKGSVAGTASPKSPDDTSSGAELPATHSRPKGGSSSAAALPQASAAASRQPKAPMSKDGREQQQQPPPRPENRSVPPSMGRALPDHAASKPPSKENVAENTAVPPGDARGASSRSDPPATAPPPPTIKKP